MLVLPARRYKRGSGGRGEREREKGMKKGKEGDRDGEKKQREGGRGKETDVIWGIV